MVTLRSANVRSCKLFGTVTPCDFHGLKFAVEVDRMHIRRRAKSGRSQDVINQCRIKGDVGYFI